MAIDIRNKKAAYTYFLTDSFEAGLKLKGTEIKSIRAGKASIGEAYCRFEKDELWVYNMYIAEYDNSGYVTHDTNRPRKLLLHSHELEKMQRKMKNVGNTIVPTRLFINDKGWAKLEISIAKGKKLHDKRDTLKKKDLKREMDRRMMG